MLSEFKGFVGKFDETTGTFLSLRDHSTDVAAVVDVLLTKTLLGERFRVLAGLKKLTDRLTQTLCYFACLHDIGKVSLVFQTKPFPNRVLVGARGHVRPSLELLSPRGPKAQKLFLSKLSLHLLDGQSGSRDQRAVLSQLLFSTFCHHGRPVPIRSLSSPNIWKPRYGLDPESEISNLMDLAKSRFPLASLKGVEFNRKAFFHGWNGILNLADWIGSDRRWFPFPISGETDRQTFAFRQARAAARSIGLDVSIPRSSLASPISFQKISRFRPRPAQEAIAALPLSSEGSTVVLEAPTGSGKTEAALWHFARLFQAGLVDGFYFALPTRSAATQIQRRIEKIVQNRLFNNLSNAERPAVIQAVPGYFRADGVDGQRPIGFEVIWSDAIEENKSELNLKAWAAEHNKRYLAGTFVVGTIDQALLSSLRVRHSHIRAASLLRHLLIVDEVHASDIYMRRILEQTIARQHRSQGHSLLMSATLGSQARLQLLNPGSMKPHTLAFQDAIQVPYPMVQMRTGQTLGEPIKIESPRSADKEIQIGKEGLGNIDKPQIIAKLALDAAKRGARVLLIRNTVNGCLEAQKTLEVMAGVEGCEDLLFGVQSGGKKILAPHHSRFSKADRKMLDDAIVQHFAPDRQSCSKGCVAVTTQTVEQSLDIDADLMITDLCPIDYLIQRLGRLHRHSLIRPEGFELPKVIVLTPEYPLCELLKEDGDSKGTHGLGGLVYADLRTLGATLIEVSNRSSIKVPCDCRELVELSTHPERLRAFGSHQGADAEKWQQHSHHIEGKGIAERGLANLGLLSWENDDFQRLSFGGELDPKIQTRLGLRDILVELKEPPSGPFGIPVQQVLVRSYEIEALSDSAATDSSLDVEEIQVLDEGKFDFRLGGSKFRYDRLGLRR